MLILGHGWLKAFFTKSRLNVLLFLWVVLFSCLFMAVSAACIFLVVRHWWLPTNEIHLPVDFVFKTVKAPGTAPSRRELMAMVNLADVGSLVPLDYSIDMKLSLPKAAANRHMGNFAVRGVLSNVPWVGHYAPDVLLNPSQDTTEKMCLLPFQSDVVRLIESLAFAPLYLFGLKEESSTLTVRLWDNAQQPLKEHPFLLVNLDKPVWVSAAELVFTAQLQGISYLLHTYPLSTFILGTAFICEVELLCAAAALLWYALASKADRDNYKVTGASVDRLGRQGVWSPRHRDPYSSQRSFPSSGHAGRAPERNSPPDEDELLIPRWFSKTGDENDTIGNGRGPRHSESNLNVPHQTTTGTPQEENHHNTAEAAAPDGLPLSPAPSPAPSP